MDTWIVYDNGIYTHRVVILVLHLIVILKYGKLASTTIVSRPCSIVGTSIKTWNRNRVRIVHTPQVLGRHPPSKGHRPIVVQTRLANNGNKSNSSAWRPPVLGDILQRMARFDIGDRKTKILYPAHPLSFLTEKGEGEKPEKERRKGSPTSFGHSYLGSAFSSLEEPHGTAARKRRKGTADTANCPRPLLRHTPPFFFCSSIPPYIMRLVDL